MKWIMYVVLAVLVVGAWKMYEKKGKTMEDLKTQIAQVQAKDDPEGLLPNLKSKLGSMEGERTFNGILMTFLITALVGGVFVLTIVPLFAQQVSMGMTGSGATVEDDGMRKARSLVAQGDYAGAMVAFRQSAAADPTNRIPWMEIVKIQKDQMAVPAAAVQTLHHVLESHRWPADDAAYFLNRLADLYQDSLGDHESAVAMLNQVVGEFPGTRHAALAKQKLLDLGNAGTAQEEAEYLARMKQGRPPNRKA